MPITFTRESIAASIAATNDMKYLPGSAYVIYYLRMTPKQEFAARGKAEFTFRAKRDVTRYLGCDPEDMDDDFEFDYTLLGSHDLANPEFSAVVDDLYKQAVEIFTKNAALIDSWYGEE